MENSKARQGAPDDDIEERNTIIVVNTPRKPKVEPEEKYIQIKNPPKLKARKKEHIEIKDDTSEDGKLKDDASEHGENRRRQRNRG